MRGFLLSKNQEIIMSNQNWKVVLTADKAKFESDMKKAKQIVKHYSDESRRYLKNIDDAMTNLNSSSKWTNRLLLFTQAGNLGQLAQGVLRYADSYTELGNRMRLVTDNNVELARATQSVFDISLKTNQAVDATSQVYQRFAQNADTLGISQKKVAELTETVSKAVAISGASSASAEAALTQFGQSLASGVFRGQEFNSVMEQTPGLAQAIAKGLGVTTGELRQMANDGKLTSDVLVKALEKAKSSVDAKFNTRIVTLSQSFTNLETRVTKYIGEADQAIGVTEGLAKGVEFLSSHLDELSSVLGVASVGLAGFYGTHKFKQHRNHINTISGNLNVLKESQIASEIALRQSQIEANLAREQLNVAQATRQKIANEIALNNAYRATSITQADKNRLTAQNIALAQQEKVAIDQLTAAQTRYNVAKNSAKQHFEQLRIAQLAVRTNQEQLARSTNLVGTAMTTAANGVKSFGAFLAANPLMLVGLIGAGIWQWYEHLEQTHQKALQFADNLSDIKEKMKEMDSISLKATKAQLEESTIAQQQEVEKLKRKVKDLQQEIAQTPKLKILEDDYGYQITIDNTAKLAQLQRDLDKENKKLADSTKKLAETQATTSTVTQQLADVSQNELDAIYQRLGITLIDVDRNSQDFNSSMLIAGNTATQVQSPLSSMMDKIFGVGDAARASAKDLYVFSHAARDALAQGKTPELLKPDEKTQQAIDRIKRRNEINNAKGQDWVSKSVNDALINQGLDPTKAGYAEMRDALTEQFQKQLKDREERAGGKTKKSLSSWKDYYNELQRANADAVQSIALNEQRSLAELEKHLKTGVVKQQEAEMARTQIAQRYAKERAELVGQYVPKEQIKSHLNKSLSELEGLKQLGLIGGGDAKEAEMRLRLKYSQDMSQYAVSAKDQVKGIYDPNQAELNRQTQELALLQSFNEQKLMTEEEYQQRKQAIIERYKNEQWQKEMGSYAEGLGALGSSFQQLANIVEQSAGKQSSAYKTMFATAKAFSIAEATMNVYLAAAKVYNDWDNMTVAERFAKSAAVLSQGMALVGKISGVGFATGGYTGDGGKFTPAGIVHKGEYVITKEATSRLGLDYLNYLNYGRRGFASGGGVAVPRVPSTSYVKSSQQNVSVTVVNNGTPVESQVSTKQNGNELQVTIELIERVANGVYSKRQAQDMRSGGVLRRQSLT